MLLVVDERGIGGRGDLLDVVGIAVRLSSFSGGASGPAVT